MTTQAGRLSNGLRWLCSLLTLWCGVSASVLPRGANAATYYVHNVNGSDSTNCGNSTSPSGSNPWRSITAAVNTCAGPGHTIRILNTGTNYTDYVSNSEGTANWPVGSSWSAGGYFTLEGDPGGPRPILKPASPGGKIGFDIHYTNQTGNGQHPQYIWINYIEVDSGVTGDSPDLVTNVSFFYGAPHLKVTNSKFHDNGGVGISGGGHGNLAGDEVVDFTFQFNEVYNIFISLDTGSWPRCKGIADWNAPCTTGGYCMYISPANSLIADNLLHDCRAYGLHFYHGGNQQLIFGNTVTRNTFYNLASNDGDRGLSTSAIVDNGHDDTFTNNIFYHINVPAVTGCEGVIVFSGDTHKAYNNTLADSPNCNGFYFKNTSGYDVRSNIIFNTGPPSYAEPGMTGTFSNNFTTNPSFVSTSAGNYHIASGSAARASVGGGCPNFFFAGVPVDVDNEARPTSGNFDCGADQVGAGPVVTASQLEFGIQPGDTEINAIITPALTVRVETSNGSLVSTATDPITLSLVSTQMPQGSLSVVSTDVAQPGWPGSNAIDGNTATAWHTTFTGSSPGHPHSIVLSFPSGTVNGLRYTPRLGPDTSGQIIGYNVYVSTDGATWGAAVATGTWGTQAGGKTYGITTTPKVGAFLKLESTSSFPGEPYASAAELNVLVASGVVPNGTLTQPAVGGIATFTLAIPTAGTAYVLKAVSGTLTSQLSTPFTITSTGGGPPPNDTATLLHYVPGR